MDNFNCGQLSALAGKASCAAQNRDAPASHRKSAEVRGGAGSPGHEPGRGSLLRLSVGQLLLSREPGIVSYRPPASQPKLTPRTFLSRCFLIISDSRKTTLGSEGPPCEGRENKQVT